MLPSVLPRLATDSAVWVFLGVWKILFLRLLSWNGAPSLPLLSLFLSFIFFPPSFWRQWAAFLGAWCPLPAFRSCFVEFTQHWNVLLMNLWGEKWSPCPIPQPTWDSPSRQFFTETQEFMQSALRDRCWGDTWRSVWSISKIPTKKNAHLKLWVIQSWESFKGSPEGEE